MLFDFNVQANKPNEYLTNTGFNNLLNVENYLITVKSFTLQRLDSTNFTSSIDMQNILANRHATESTNRSLYNGVCGFFFSACTSTCRSE